MSVLVKKNISDYLTLPPTAYQILWLPQGGPQRPQPETIKGAIFGHTRAVHSKGPGSMCPAYHLVLILGTFFYLRDGLKYVRDALTQMTVHQIMGTQ